MADVATTTGADDGETPNQRQARLRREKRAKKMAEQGEDRLNRIKQLNGGVAPPDEVLGGPDQSAPKVASVADDPAEVDISSQTFPTNSGNNTSQPQQNDPFGMLQMLQQQGQAGGGGGGPAADDPLMRMMQQMMGSMGGGQQQGPNAPGSGQQQQQLPDFLQAMMQGSKQDAPQESPSTGSAYVWRIVHAVFALALAGYISLASTFNGSALLRGQNVYTEAAGHGFGPRLFLIFTTAELVLQSGRYFLEKGQLQGGGVLAKVANSGFVPEPYAGYVRILGRYISIAQTIFSDVMVIIFVFGAMAWWKGAAAS